MIISSRPVGQLRTVQELAIAFRDLEIERRQILAALNILLAQSPAGQLLVPFSDDTGTPAMYRLIQGAGVTLTFDAVAKTLTISSP